MEKLSENKNIQDIYQSLFEGSCDAVMTLEPPDWRFTKGNPSTLTMFRAKDAAAFISVDPWQLSPECQPDGRKSSEKAMEMIRIAMRDGSNRFEWQHKRLDGEVFTAIVLLSRIGTGQDQFLLSVVRDITEYKHTENVMKMRLSLYEYAESHTLEEILTRTLDELEVLTGSLVSFYHFLEPDQETLSLQTWSTRTQELFCKAEGKGSHYHISMAGVWVDCVHQRKPVIHNDYGSLPHRKGLPSGHAPVIRELVVPIMRKDKIVAILGIGNKPVEYNEEDIKLVSFLADVAWTIAERKKIAEEKEALIIKLQKALEEVKTLSGLIPICANCKKIRDDSGYWKEVERYFNEKSGAEFSHGICPDCLKKLYPKYADKILNDA